MIKFIISSGQTKDELGLPLIFGASDLNIWGTGLLHAWKGTLGDYTFLFGDVIGTRNQDGTISSITDKKEIEHYLEDRKRPVELEGRFVVVVAKVSGHCEIWTDQFGRVDIYWQQTRGCVFVASALDMLPSVQGCLIDSVGMAHSLAIYGSRPAKKHSLYKGIHRLGVNEVLEIAKFDVSVIQRDFNAREVLRNFGTTDLDRYSDIFIESVRARASSSGNIVYLSSGWDSTSILAVLVYLFGKDKVRAVIGRMKYSQRSGVINQFEIDRAKQVADYYGITLDIIEFDYRTNVQQVIDQVEDLFRAQMFANLAGLNHWKLAEATARKASGDEVVFAGEMSDGAHNLGFSQFTTIYHPASQDFREYSDKMSSYLFGPTFLGQLEAGTYEQDPVWQILKSRAGSHSFDPIATGRHAIVQQLLSSFFLRSNRLPLYSLNNVNLLTNEGRETLASESERIYLSRVAETITKENLYSHYLHLYNSFHWQGATVATLEHTAEVFGLRLALPFNDGALIEFLSRMPERCGRGLDLNPTKYPLKWMLKHRIDYPLHLQTGPHSYTYDIDPNFSLTGEILNHSGFRDLFQRCIQKGDLKARLDKNFFDLDYLDQISERYLKGEEMRGREMLDLSALAMHETIGLY
jgi:hypothetical protein